MGSNRPPQPCGRAHPDHGSKVVCELPEGHEGVHRAKDTRTKGPDELFWLWADCRDPDSERP